MCTASLKRLLVIYGTLQIDYYFYIKLRYVTRVQKGVRVMDRNVRCSFGAAVNT